MDNNDDDDFDTLLSSIGFGRWQVPTMVAVVLVVLQYPIHLVGSPLLSGPLPFRCSHLDNATAIPVTGISYFNDECIPLPGTHDKQNATANTSVTTTILAPPENTERHLTSMISCPVIEYNTSIFTSTVISEWHLVCERKHLQPLFQMMYNVGGIFGSFVGGHIGDKWGRRRSLQIGIVSYVLVVIAMAFTSSFPFLMVLRILTGVTGQSMLIPTWSQALESAPSRHRSLVGMLLGFPYSVFVIVFSGVGYLIRSWRYLMLVCCAPSLALLPLSSLMDESARWLVQQGRQDEAMKVLKRAVKLNKVSLSSPLESIVEKLSQNSEPKPEEEAAFSVRESFQQAMAYLRSPIMRTIILVTPLLWFLQSCLYLAVAINANNFNSSNPFLYVCLSGVMDGSAILLMTPLTTFLGRRVIVGVGLFVGGIFFLLDLAVSVDYFWVKMTLVMVGFFLVAGSFQMNYVYGPELFPTEARSRGFAFVNLMGGIGFMIAPVFTYNLAKITWWAAPVTFGCAAILGSFTLPLLPETRNQPMPDTLKDVEVKLVRRRKVAEKQSGSCDDTKDSVG
ncbi:solute carrier family 22 member 20-like [Penaeus japonicus]|uniref:solute carrier family 22 member 20-like n=1 Tax=Penaeus japonicus TaxID=27405 RepID=UPI001C71322A|nr:solute carrier family 22 member 20-like [Penaeus japonicus]XP_042876741.1 solute carrier family 22 member 20-like [Penaeus japonicus]